MFERLSGELDKNKQAIIISSGFFVLTLLLSYFYPWFSDSVAHITYADFIIKNLSLPYAEYSLNAGKAYVAPPFFHFLLAISKVSFGYYGVLPAFSGAVSIILTYKLVNLWYDKETAFYSALALALFPFFINWSSKIYVGTTVTAGFLSVFYTYFLYRKTGNKSYLYYSFIIGGLLMSLKTYGSLSSFIVASHIFWENKDNIGSLKLKFKETFLPGLLGVVVSLPWPLRNIIRTGSPVPKLTGNPLSYTLPAITENTSVILQSWEIERFLVQMIGVRPPILDVLYDIHPLVYFGWFIIPLSVIGLLVYGAVEEKENSFVWLWLFSLVSMYSVARVLSSGAFGLKFRHFITFSPILGLFVARSYQKFDFRPNVKKIVFVLLALGLVFQTAFSIAEASYAVDAAHNPLGDWLDQNVGEDEVIYTLRDRSVIQYTEKDFKIITKSYKEGYINPERNFSRELRDKADWVVVTDPIKFGSEQARVMEAESQRVLELVKNLDATKPLLWGSVGKKWKIYRVNSSDG